MTQQIQFVQGTIFHQEEGDFVEFKTITSKRPVTVIVDHTEEYVTGFLNAQVAGDLYLGIDNGGIIQGVTLNRNERDDIHKNILSKLGCTDPPIPHEYYRTTVHGVFNSEQEPIENSCVVQIHIIKTEVKYLYKTSGGSVYLKKGSSCKKLNSKEIAEIIERRVQIHLQKDADELDKRLEKDPNDRSLLKKRADIAMYMSDIPTMYNIYEKILELNPRNRIIRIDYATARKSIGDLEGALSILNDALQLDNNDSSTLNSQGSILKTKGSTLQGLDRWNEALQSYQEALKLKPDDYTILTQIGVTLRELGKYKESIQFLNYAISKSPNYRLAKYEKKKTYCKIYEGGMKIKSISEIQ
jgi:Flp pilus assembly protein TadD